ncbi:MAG TPA: FhaA domain-containing protein [Actinomycetota bacterium]
MRVNGVRDHLGHLIPRGSVGERAIRRALIEVMDRERYRSGNGVPAIPTRYVVRMHPADRAWFDPATESRLALELTTRAQDVGLLQIGEVTVELRADPRLVPGCPTYWCGFGEGDLLVLADPSAALDVFGGRARRPRALGAR